MNWKNIKTFMIILIAAANIFLAIMLITNSGSNIYSKETIENISAILSDSGITADKSLFGAETKHTMVYAVDHNIEKAAKVAEKLMNEVPENVFMTPDGVSFYSDDGSVLSYGSNMQISYISSGYSLPESFSFATPTEKISKKLNELLISKLCKNEYFGFVIDSVDTSGDIYYYLLTQTLDSVEINNHSLICGIKDGKLVTLSGKWCFLSADEIIDAHILDSVNILLNEANQGRRISEDNPAFNKEATVKSISQCYISQFNSDGSTLIMMPIWKIDWSDERPAVFYDAISGEYVEY